MKWTDVQLIAIELFEKYPGIDPLTLRFTDLHQKCASCQGSTMIPSAPMKKF